jgi:nucleoside-diphosphate-sugar epimerase
MKILATGTSGLIGSQLKEAQPIYLELREKSTYPKILDESDSTLIHLSGIVGETKVNNNLRKAYSVNVTGTLTLAEHVRNYSNWRFIFVSSSHVYKPSHNFHRESDPLVPINNYGLMKQETESELISLFSQEPWRLCIARVFSVLGTGMPKGTLGWAIENLSVENPLRFSDDIRDFLTPLQIAQDLEMIAKLTFHFPILNICSGVKTRIRDACLSLRSGINSDTFHDLILEGNSSIPCIVGDRTRFEIFKSYGSEEISNAK